MRDVMQARIHRSLQDDQNPRHSTRNASQPVAHQDHARFCSRDKRALFVKSHAIWRNDSHRGKRDRVPAVMGKRTLHRCVLRQD